MGSTVDVLIFIGQALAIAALGYIVSQAYACTAKYRDPRTWRPANFANRSVKVRTAARTEQVTLHFSFVPESAGVPRDDAADAREEKRRTLTSAS
jgi:hypothetical protein